MFDVELETMITLNKSFKNQFDIFISILKDLPFINSLVHRVNNVGKCPIYTNDFLLGEEVVEMPCHPSHIFHSHYIQPWLFHQSTCLT